MKNLAADWARCSAKADCDVFFHDASKARHDTAPLPNLAPKPLPCESALEPGWAAMLHAQAPMLNRPSGAARRPLLEHHEVLRQTHKQYGVRATEQDGGGSLARRPYDGEVGDACSSEGLPLLLCRCAGVALGLARKPAPGAWARTSTCGGAGWPCTRAPPPTRCPHAAAVHAQLGTGVKGTHLVALCEILTELKCLNQVAKALQDEGYGGFRPHFDPDRKGWTIGIKAGDAIDMMGADLPKALKAVPEGKLPKLVCQRLCEARGAERGAASCVCVGGGGAGGGPTARCASGAMGGRGAARCAAANQ